jgi:hypothetical protein
MTGSLFSLVCFIGFNLPPVAPCFREKSVSASSEKNVFLNVRGLKPTTSNSIRTSTDALTDVAVVITQEIEV